MLKKLLSTILATAMILAMPTTVFANDGELEEGDIVFLGNMVDHISGISFWYYLNDDNSIDGSGYADTSALQPGDRIFTPLHAYDPESEGDFIAPATKEDVYRWRVQANWQFDFSEDAVKSVSIETVGGRVIKETDTPGVVEIGELVTAAGVVIEIKENLDIDKVDLVGNLRVYKSSPSAYTDELQLSGSRFATVGYDTQSPEETIYPIYASTSNNIIPFSPMLPPSIYNQSQGAPVVTFDGYDSADVVDLDFAGVGMFTVGGLADQEDLFLSFTGEPNMDVLKAYPTTDIYFTNFPSKPMFNHFGLWDLYTEEDAFVYAMMDGKLVTLEEIIRPNSQVTPNEYGDGINLTLKQFPDSFVYADAELDLTIFNGTMESVPATPITEAVTDATLAE